MAIAPLSSLRQGGTRSAAGVPRTGY